MNIQLFDLQPLCDGIQWGSFWIALSLVICTAIKYDSP